MGSFLGHLLPGLYFLVLGSWGSSHTSSSYWRSRRTPWTYRSQESHQGSVRVPWESGVKLVAFSVQVRDQDTVLVTPPQLVGELVTGWVHSAMWNNANHVTMVLFFMVNSVIEMSYFYKVSNIRKQFSSDTSVAPAPWIGLYLRSPGLCNGGTYIILTGSVMFEAFLFSSHTHGKPMIEQEVRCFPLPVTCGPPGPPPALPSSLHGCWTPRPRATVAKNMV